MSALSSRTRTRAIPYLYTAFLTRAPVLALCAGGLWRFVKCKRRALRIRKLREAGAAGHFHRAVHQTRALRPGAKDGRIQIRDLHVVRPHRRHGHVLRLGEHAAELFASRAVNQVLAHPAHVEVTNLLPAKERAVKAESRFVV